MKRRDFLKKSVKGLSIVGGSTIFEIACESSDAPYHEIEINGKKYLNIQGSKTFYELEKSPIKICDYKIKKGHLVSEYPATTIGQVQGLKGIHTSKLESVITHYNIYATKEVTPNNQGIGGDCPVLAVKEIKKGDPIYSTLLDKMIAKDYIKYNTAKR